jgi:long-chain fatty acid transport protein
MKRSLCLVALFTAGASQAAGLAIDTQAARPTGMAGAVVAHTHDSSSIFYNPAGLMHVSRWQAEVGATLIAPRLTFTPEGGEGQTQTPLSVPPHAYFAWRLTPELAAGLGVFTPFGANSDWPEDFVGRFVAQRSRLATFDINPALAFAPWEWLRLGFGAQVVCGTINIQRAATPLVPGSTVELSGDAWSFGYNAGVQADVVKGLVSVGAQFRSGLTLGFNGTADFEGLPPALGLVDQPISSELRLPATLGLGVSVTPLPRLLLALDAWWAQWNTVQSIDIRFEESDLTQSQLKNWRNRWNVRLGAEYGVTEALAVRAGFNYDPTPSRPETLTPELPDVDRLRFAAGLGYRFGAFQAGLGYQFLVLRETRSTATLPVLPPGTYRGTANTLTLTLGYVAPGS